MIPAIEFQGIGKSFHGVRANHEIHFQVRKGSIHAVIGENGAGKSTAMNILYGTYPPDAGQICIHGKPWAGRGHPWGSPHDAIEAGIGMVHQHFMLGGPFTVLDNILLGFEPSTASSRFLPKSLRWVNRKAARKKLEEISKRYGLAIDLDAYVEDLPVGIQQRIEIIKLLYRNAEILILDEPTAVLTPLETADLFDHLKQLCQEGKTILMITHKLKEVMSLAHQVTVFRAGQVVGERKTQHTDTEELAALMVGRKMSLTVEVPAQPGVGAPVVELKGVHLNTRRKLQNLDLQVREGEIVGIAGVEGNGQSELIQLLLHPKDHRNRLKGEIRLFGQEASLLTSAEVKALGVGVIPDDRLRDALLLARPVSENFILGLHRRQPFNKKGLLNWTEVQAFTRRALEEYDIRPRSTGISAEFLSGGNQQKLVIAREFFHSPQFLIAAQPTRGVDVGAIEFIHSRILKARSAGAGVLLISSELEEILALSDRILVMYEGRMIAQFTRGQASERILGMHMGGAVH